MARKLSAGKPAAKSPAKPASKPLANPETDSALVAALAAPVGRPSALLDTRVIYCGDCLEQLKNLPDGCIDLIYIDPPFNSNRNYEVPGGWGETKEKRAMSGGKDRRASAEAYIDSMRPHRMRPSPCS